MAHSLRTTHEFSLSHPELLELLKRSYPSVGFGDNALIFMGMSLTGAPRLTITWSDDEGRS